MAHNADQRPVRQAMHTAMKPHGLLFAAKGLSERDVDKGLALAGRVHPKYQPVFDRLSEADRAAVALYFLPHGSKKDVLEVTRPRVVKWYCPFADQREFPSGHRYSITCQTCETVLRTCSRRPIGAIC